MVETCLDTTNLSLISLNSLAAPIVFFFMLSVRIGLTLFEMTDNYDVVKAKKVTIHTPHFGIGAVIPLKLMCGLGMANTFAQTLLFYIFYFNKSSPNSQEFACQLQSTLIGLILSLIFVTSITGILVANYLRHAFTRHKFAHHVASYLTSTHSEPRIAFLPCGRGTWVTPIAKKFVENTGDHAQVCCLDAFQTKYFPENSDWLKENLTLEGVFSRVTVIPIQYDHLSLANESCDVIVIPIGNVIVYLREIEDEELRRQRCVDFVNQCYRILRPGGKLISSNLMLYEGEWEKCVELSLFGSVEILSPWLMWSSIPARIAVCHKPLSTMTSPPISTPFQDGCQSETSQDLAVNGAITTTSTTTTTTTTTTSTTTAVPMLASTTNISNNRNSMDSSSPRRSSQSSLVALENHGGSSSSATLPTSFRSSSTILTESTSSSSISTPSVFSSFTTSSSTSISTSPSSLSSQSTMLGPHSSTGSSAISSPYFGRLRSPISSPPGALQSSSSTSPSSSNSPSTPWTLWMMIHASWQVWFPPGLHWRITECLIVVALMFWALYVWLTWYFLVPLEWPYSLPFNQMISALFISNVTLLPFMIFLLTGRLRQTCETLEFQIQRDVYQLYGHAATPEQYYVVEKAFRSTSVGVLVRHYRAEMFDVLLMLSANTCIAWGPYALLDFILVEAKVSLDTVDTINTVITICIIFGVLKFLKSFVVWYMKMKKSQEDQEKERVKADNEQHLQRLSTMGTLDAFDANPLHSDVL